MENDTHHLAALQLLNMTVPMVLNTCVQLGVLEVISNAGADAQLSTAEIVACLGGFPNPDAPAMLDRMFRLLASHSVLTCSLQIPDQGGHHQQPIRVYGLTPVGNYFVRNQDGFYLGTLLAVHQDKVFTNIWQKLKDAVTEGGSPFDMVHGMHVFEYSGSDSRFNEVFNKGMIDHTTMSVNQILQTYQGFNHVHWLVDVGGGLGIALNLITSKYPKVKGINFDLPHVIQHAQLYPGVEHVAGDMFESVPNGDAILLKWILHDWSDGHCLKLLKNCYKALPKKGKVIVVDAVLPVLPDSSSAVKVNIEADMIMMTRTPGGKERTHDEFVSLAIGAGFTGIRLECTISDVSVMEFYK